MKRADCQREEMHLEHRMAQHADGYQTVVSEDEALDHIATYGSGHSESIVSNNETAQKKFQAMVDAACVYVNAPTSFHRWRTVRIGRRLASVPKSLEPADQWH